MEAAILASVVTGLLIGASLIMRWYEKRHPDKPDDDRQHDSGR